MTTGMDLRDQGTAAVIAADTAPHRGAGDFIRSVIQDFAALSIEFTADDIRDALRDNDTVTRELYHRPNLLPAHLGSAAHRGLIEAVGLYRPTRASRRASRNLVWKGKS